MQFASPCDPRTRRFVTPTRLVWQTSGACAPVNVTRLLQAASGQATYPPPPCCSLPPGAGLLLDNAARIDELVPAGRVDVHRDRGNFCYKGWRHSLCHGWAGGPAAWLTEHVLGIRPTAPGCAAVSITPHLGTLTFAEGVLPTVHGPVRVRHVRRASGDVTSEVQAPAAVQVVRA